MGVPFWNQTFHLFFTVHDPSKRAFMGPRIHLGLRPLKDGQMRRCRESNVTHPSWAFSPCFFWGCLPLTNHFLPKKTLQAISLEMKDSPLRCPPQVLWSSRGWSNIPFLGAQPQTYTRIQSHISVYTWRVRSQGRPKACRPTAPKWARVAAQNRRNVSKVAGMPEPFCSKYSRWQCTGSWAQPPGTPNIKVDLLPHTAKQLQPESSKTGFCEWHRWFRGTRFACAYLYHADAALISQFVLAFRTAAKNVLKSY